MAETSLERLRRLSGRNVAGVMPGVTFEASEAALRAAGDPAAAPASEVRAATPGLVTSGMAAGSVIGGIFGPGIFPGGAAGGTAGLVGGAGIDAYRTAKNLERLYRIRTGQPTDSVTYNNVRPGEVLPLPGSEDLPPTEAGLRRRGSEAIRGMAGVPGRITEKAVSMGDQFLDDQARHTALHYRDLARNIGELARAAGVPVPEVKPLTDEEQDELFWGRLDGALAVGGGVAGKAAAKTLRWLARGGRSERAVKRLLGGDNKQFIGQRDVGGGKPQASLSGSIARAGSVNAAIDLAPELTPGPDVAHEWLEDVAAASGGSAWFVFRETENLLFDNTRFRKFAMSHPRIGVGALVGGATGFLMSRMAEKGADLAEQGVEFTDEQIDEAIRWLDGEVIGTEREDEILGIAQEPTTSPGREEASRTLTDQIFRGVGSDGMSGAARNDDLDSGSTRGGDQQLQDYAIRLYQDYLRRQGEYRRRQRLSIGDRTHDDQFPDLKSDPISDPMGTIDEILNMLAPGSAR